MTAPRPGIPHLDGWVTLPEAALELSLSKQAVHKMAFERHLFPSLHALGKRPIYVVSDEDVAAIKQRNVREHSDAMQPI